MTKGGCICVERGAACVLMGGGACVMRGACPPLTSGSHLLFPLVMRREAILSGGGCIDRTYHRWHIYSAKA